MASGQIKCLRVQKRPDQQQDGSIFIGMRLNLFVMLAPLYQIEDTSATREEVANWRLSRVRALEESSVGATD